MRNICCQKAIRLARNVPQKNNPEKTFAFKAEYEVLIKAWCGGTGNEEIKIDIYQQLRMNWDSFIPFVYGKMFAKFLGEDNNG